MLTRRTKTYTLFGVPHVQPDGSASAPQLGEIRALISSRSSEESEENDFWHASETASAVIAPRYAPEGGFARGMSLTRGGAVYRILTPVFTGRMWVIKCMRMHV